MYTDNIKDIYILSPNKILTHKTSLAACLLCFSDSNCIHV